ncbi:hypothetical protein L6258_02370 [Candidatus Parcubacteria bacterium]|nr:hypothetical protein [Candidatus Parcubacteria bacterium]
MAVIFFLTLGIFSIISQITIVRELMAAGRGDELTAGIVLGIWLVETGLGSWLAKLSAGRVAGPSELGRGRRGRVTLKFQPSKIWFLIPLLLPLEVITIRLTFGKVWGSGVASPFQALFLASVLLLPFCLVLGALFTFGYQTYRQRMAISRAYFWETIGLAIGGLLFNFVLAKTTFPLPYPLELESLSFRHPNTIEVANSSYGKITVAEDRGQFNFYESGTFLASSFNPKSNEFLAQLATLQHENPREILLIGGGLDGLLGELLKVPSVQKIDYLELDPTLVKTVVKYLPESLRSCLHDEKVTLHLVDGRAFLKEAPQKYDLVVANLPNPSTALLNRYYTQEFFEEVQSRLASEGILALTLSLPTTFLNQEARSLLALTSRTLGVVFAEVLILPEEERFVILAADSAGLVTDATRLSQRQAEREVETAYFTSQDLRLILQRARTETFLPTDGAGEINSDFRPLGYLRQASFWRAMFRTRPTRPTSVWALVLGVAVLAVVVRYRGERRWQPFWLVGTAAFSLMAFEVSIILLFQSYLGFLFGKIALIFTTALFFLGLGNRLGAAIAGQPRRLLLIWYGLIILFCLGFGPVVRQFPSQATFFTLAAGIGFLAGAIFPLARRMLPENGREISLYVADLVGAAAGAVLTSTWLIPTWGVGGTVLVVLLVNLGAICLLMPHAGDG